MKISKEYILSKVSEEKIFSLVFGYIPEEYQMVHSPFRKDDIPKCYFEYFNGRLTFVDFASTLIYNGRKTVVIDCFNAVQMYYNLGSFYQTLSFINTKLILNKKLKPLKQKVIVNKKKVIISCIKRNFNIFDKQYWTQFGITKEQLIFDNVFAVSDIIFVKDGKSNIIKPKNIAYCISGFENRCKVYQPMSKKFKWVSTLVGNDVGGIENIIHNNQLVITKSYKDYRVLLNQGLNVIWFQSENTIPNDELLRTILNRVTNIVIFYDNDNAGITGSNNLKKYLKLRFNVESREVSLPKKSRCTDPAEVIQNYGYGKLKEFLKNNNLI